MPNYKYVAIDTTGQRVEEKIRANSKNEVVDMIKQNRCFPVSIEVIDEEKDIKNISLFQSSKVKTKDIAIFCRQFYTMLNAGVTIVSCLEILKFQTENKNLKKVIRELYEDVQTGKTLSEALKTYNKIFPDLLIHMIETGEVTGNLDRIMERMAIYFEKENKINSKVKSAMVYPTILSMVATGIVIFLLTFVMPTFVEMFTKNGAELPGITKLLLGVSGTLKKYWYIFLTGIAMILSGIGMYRTTDEYKNIIDKLKLKIPIVKGTIQKIITSRFTRTLSILLYSGVPLMQALEIVSKVVGNKVAEGKILAAREEVRRGADLATPIRNSGIFPSMVDSMIRIGEESGALDDILDKAANFYDEEVDASMQKMTTVIEPLMIVVMAVVIGFIVIAMVLPMFDMMNAVPM